MFFTALSLIVAFCVLILPAKALWVFVLLYCDVLNEAFLGEASLVFWLLSLDESLPTILALLVEGFYFFTQPILMLTCNMITFFCFVGMVAKSIHIIILSTYSHWERCCKSCIVMPEQCSNTNDMFMYQIGLLIFYPNYKSIEKIGIVLVILPAEQNRTLSNQQCIITNIYIKYSTTIKKLFAPACVCDG